jgi:hypothetical protein
VNRALVLIACIALAIASASAQRGGAVDERTRRIAGCYTLSVGRWFSGADTMAMPERMPPARFRLDSVGIEHFPAEYHQVMPTSGVTPLNMDSWRWIDSNRIAVRWSANTVSGVELDLRVRADTLVGMAATFGEPIMLGRPFPAAPVVARRTVCRTSVPSTP